ncbi:MAG TPA: carboxypeptidase-like regulatory domain-containing protein [Bacteroidia bacterium]|nr:carboxypeptidase-like regulatory domain-containing protein [Bacteroidia bacterium]
MERKKNGFAFSLFVILALALLVPHFAGAQGGTVSGKVSDKVTGETMPGVVVLLDSTGKKGAVTDFDGNYTINGVEAGGHSLTFKFISYQTLKVTDVNVSSGKTTTVNAVMELALDTSNIVVIKSSRVTNSEAAVTDEMHNNNNVSSGISGQQISKSKDRDASEVVKRIPGVTVIDNRFIMVRGLNERYNNVWLNDAGAPSSETDKRAFSFDMVPSGTLDRIMVYKTPSPDLPGDFAGGMVRIYTKAFPEKTILNFSFESNYRAGTTFRDFNYTDGTSKDIFGMGAAMRHIPDGLPAYISRNDPNYTQISQAFPNNWALHTRQALPDMRFSMMWAQPFTMGKKITAGNTLGLGYSRTLTTFSIRRQDWDSTAQISDYTDIQCTDQVRVSAVENFSMLIGRQKVEFKNLLNQIGKSYSTYRYSNYADGPNEKSYVFGYESRTIYSSQLAGTFKGPKERSVYSFTGGYSYLLKDAPDLRRIAYTKQQNAPDSMYKAGISTIVDPVNGGGRLYQWLQEQTWSLQQNFLQKVNLFDTTIEINIGTYSEYKTRQFIARVLGYTINPGFTAFNLTREPLETIFSPDNVGGFSTFRVDEITNPSDKYTAQNLLLAGYGMAKIPIGKHLAVIGGLRYEYNEQSLQGYVNLDSISPKVITRFYLPSVNMTYNFNRKTLIRAAYGKTVNRPEFREWSPFYFYDFEFKAGTYGSLFPTVVAQKGQLLDVARVDNYDLRFEFYPNAGDYIHVGVFYKSFVEPIQQIILNSGGADSRAFTFVNADYAFVEGAELDMRKNLAVFDTLFHTSVFGNFNTILNVSVMKSRLYLDPSQVVNQSAATPLQGQSPYVVNAGIYYQNDSIGLQASLLYNVFGPRLYLVGTLDYANIGELPRNSFDFVVTQRITPWLSVSGGVQDIFNQPVQMVQDTDRNGKFERNGQDKEILNYRRGRYYTIGITFSPQLNKGGK